MFKSFSTKCSKNVFIPRLRQASMPTHSIISTQKFHVQTNACTIPSQTLADEQNRNEKALIDNISQINIPNGYHVVLCKDYMCTDTNDNNNSNNNNNDNNNDSGSDNNNNGDNNNNDNNNNNNNDNDGGNDDNNDNNNKGKTLESITQNKDDGRSVKTTKTVNFKL